MKQVHWLLLFSLFLSSTAKQSSEKKSDSIRTDTIIDTGKALQDTLGGTISKVEDSSNAEHQLFLDKVKSEAFRKVLELFPFEKIPFRLRFKASENNPLEKEEVLFFTNEEEFGYNTYFPDFVSYQENRIAVLLMHHYTPGAYGIDNELYELYLFDYNGKLLKKEEIGCNCYDSNMGINDYYSTSLDSVFIDKNKIRVYSKQVHGTLIEDEENKTPSFYEEKRDSSVISY